MFARVNQQMCANFSEFGPDGVCSFVLINRCVQTSLSLDQVYQGRGAGGGAGG